MRIQIIKYIILFLVTFLIQSCSSVFLGIYGIKEPNQIDKESIYHYAQKYNIDTADCYELDTTYIDYLLTHDTFQFAEQIKNHYQPLQALYYNRIGQLESFQVNCYTSGFPNLKWNNNKVMTTFPPKPQAPLDSLVSLHSQLKYLIPPPKPVKFYEDTYDYVVIVFWNRFMGRQSKRLIKTVQKNCHLAQDKKVKIIYVNNDNLLAIKLE